MLPEPRSRRLFKGSGAIAHALLGHRCSPCLKPRHHRLPAPGTSGDRCAPTNVDAPGDCDVPANGDAPTNVDASADCDAPANVDAPTHRYRRALDYTGTTAFHAGGHC